MGHKRKKTRKMVPGDCTTGISYGHHVAIAPRNDTEGRKKSKGGAPEFDVRIRISKRPNTDHFTGDIQANNTADLVMALAVMMQKAADLVGAPVEQVYAVVATLLLKETSSVSPDGADTFPRGEGSEGMED